MGYNIQKESALVLIFRSRRGMSDRTARREEPDNRRRQESRERSQSPASVSERSWSPATGNRERSKSPARVAGETSNRTDYEAIANEAFEEPLARDLDTRPGPADLDEAENSGREVGRYAAFRDSEQADFSDEFK